MSHSQVCRWQVVLPARGEWKQARDWGGVGGVGGSWLLCGPGSLAPSSAPSPLPTESRTQGAVSYFCQSRAELELTCQVLDSKVSHNFVLSVLFLSNPTHTLVALSCYERGFTTSPFPPAKAITTLTDKGLMQLVLLSIPCRWKAVHTASMVLVLAHTLPQTSESCVEPEPLPAWVLPCVLHLPGLT